MEIQITGKGVDLSTSLKSHVESSLESHVKKYLQDTGHAKVVLCKDGQLFHIDITLNNNHGALMKVSANHQSPYSVVDSAVIRLTSKLRRYKHTIQNHHSRTPQKSIKTMQAMIQHSYDDMEGSSLTKEEIANPAPLITEEQTIDIQVLSIADSIIHMELMSLPALMFINIENHQVNMVYKRQDGNIAWVEAPDVLQKLS